MQFESVIEDNSRGIVHHMEVFHCESGAENQMPLYRGPCFSEKRPYKTQVCKKVMAAWAMGAAPFVYPEVRVDHYNYNILIYDQISYIYDKKKIKELNAFIHGLKKSKSIYITYILLGISILYDMYLYIIIFYFFKISNF